MAGTAVRTRSRSAKAVPGRPKAPARPAVKASVIGRVLARPGVIVAGATFAAVMTGIVANALLFQKGQHPSPLFSTAPVAPAAPVTPPPVAPTPVQRLTTPEPLPATPVAEAPASAAPIPAAAPPAPVRRPAAKSGHTVAIPVAKPGQKAARAPHHDPIGDLLSKQER